MDNGPALIKKLLLAAALAGGVPGARARAQSAARPTQPEAATASYQGRAFPRRRTPIEQLPLGGQAEILRLETLLQQAYTALLAAPATPVFPYWRADAVEQAARQAAAVEPTWNQEAYQREAAFYAAEETRRHPAAPKP